MSDLKAFVAVISALYLLTWGASGCTAWGQNEGVKCQTGYNPVTHICTDPEWIEKCSGWSAPGFCWHARRPNLGKEGGQ